MEKGAKLKAEAVRNLVNFQMYKATTATKKITADMLT